MTIFRQTILIDGLPIRYGVAGQGEPVVLIHGLSGSSRWWSRNIPAIAQHHQVYLIDLPGFGTMRRFSQQFDLKQCASWLDSWMQTIGLESAYLVGHSMGGFVCMALAALRPEKVKRLVLVNSIGISFEQIKNRLPAMMVKAIGRTNPAFWPYLAYDYLRAGPKMVWRASRQIIALDAASIIASVVAPTLLIWGADDDLVPLAFGHQLHQQIAGSSLLVIQRANHICMFDRPHDFNAALLAFLQGQEVGVPAAS